MSKVNVGTRGELLHAIEVAQPGSVILLTEGDYGSVALKNNRYSSAITVMSADASAPARIGSLSLDKVVNLVVRNVELGEPLDGRPLHTPFVTVANSANILFDGVHVHGTLDGDPSDDGYGIVVRDSRSIAVMNSTFEQLGRGFVVSQSSDVRLLASRFHDLRSDGADFAEVTNVVVDGNRFTDFYPVEGDHADAIQFWTNGTKTPSSDIRIANNVVLQGEGKGMQGIFMRDNQNLPYRNVVISNNLVYVNTEFNGITLIGGSNVEILGNTVLSQPEDRFRLRIRVERVTDGRIGNNVADIYLPKDLGAVAVEGNLFLLDAPGDAGLIPNLLGGPAATVDDLLVDGLGFQPRPTIPPPDEGAGVLPGTGAAPTITGSAARSAISKKTLSYQELRAAA